METFHILLIYSCIFQSIHFEFYLYILREHLYTKLLTYKLLKIFSYIFISISLTPAFLNPSISIFSLYILWTFFYQNCWHKNPSRRCYLFISISPVPAFSEFLLCGVLFYQNCWRKNPWRCYLFIFISPVPAFSKFFLCGLFLSELLT